MFYEPQTPVRKGQCLGKGTVETYSDLQSYRASFRSGLCQFSTA
ncbi:hypothetical protein THF1C08_820003 [Vibrio jasicida]|uniref:Uncharacterized protein n=1 Tax=Vibrio jasicida TaxID=766224 RepID=A0AAU9QXH3_9VIBR|nr:hypothetical protein THF1C08_820003 [Vibrio jasicida]CAH1603857.1 hypothetical protein THF1A12_840003 [Vibrio jasicida]